MTLMGRRNPNNVANPNAENINMKKSDLDFFVKTDILSVNVLYACVWTNLVAIVGRNRKNIPNNPIKSFSVILACLTIMKNNTDNVRKHAAKIYDNIVCGCFIF